jgi:hypothetical protein
MDRCVVPSKDVDSMTGSDGIDRQWRVLVLLDGQVQFNCRKLLHRGIIFRAPYNSLVPWFVYVSIPASAEFKL